MAKDREQAEEYCLGLKDNEHPRYLLLSDFQTFELFDLEEGEDWTFSLKDLSENIEKLSFIIGVQKRTFKDQDPVNIEASELMGRVHDTLKDSGYVGHDLEQFLVRILFCLFADDTGIFEPRGIFETLIKDRTSEDGSDLGQWLSSLFDVLNTPEDKRYKTLDEDLAVFPYVNGELFAARLPIPAFNSDILEVLIEMRQNTQLSLDATSLSVIDVDQFYGIEIGEFPARIAEVAMWMMNHIMNNRLSLEFGKSYVRIPLEKSPHIRHADALEFDWNELLPHERCTFIFGNPPFLGAKYQLEEQRAQVRKIANLGGSGGTLDYVTAWFLKAGEYINSGRTKIGFVATNSITQGEQVAQLWPLLFRKYGLEIIYAHRTFAWGSDARGKAHVHVVIVGLCHRNYEPSNKRLFSYPDIKGDPEESKHQALTAYLFDAEKLTDRHLLVSEISRPINGLAKLVVGSQPIDGGHYIFDREEKEKFIEIEPKAKEYFHPYIGSREYLNGRDLWILYLSEENPSDLKKLPEVTRLIEAVREYRKASTRKSTQKLADTPTQFNITVVTNTPFLVLPRVSSERREYFPIGWLKPPVIPSDAVLTIPKMPLGADRSIFSVLTSAMHMAWLRYIGGRLKSDYRYSIGLVYNNFPFPAISDTQHKKFYPLAQKILDIRNSYPTSSLADLYDPNHMPVKLRKAHKDIDLAVDKIYRKTPFKSESERVEHLFGLYEKMMAHEANLPLLCAQEVNGVPARR